MKVCKPKRPDCNSCHHFSKHEYYEPEDYCTIRKEWVDPKEGEECEQFEPHSLYCDTDSMKENEFNLNSATKYEDGESMMTDLPVQFVRLLKRIELLEKKVRDDEIGKYSAHSLKEYFDDEMSEEMKAVADKYIKHDERIEICESNIENLDYRLEEIERKLGNILIALRYSDLTHLDIEPNQHVGSNFCGNCTHVNKYRAEDGIYACELSGEIVDPDDSSCAMFEPPF